MESALGALREEMGTELLSQLNSGEQAEVNTRHTYTIRDMFNCRLTALEMKFSHCSNT